MLHNNILQNVTHAPTICCLTIYHISRCHIQENHIIYPWFNPYRTIYCTRL